MHTEHTEHTAEEKPVHQLLEEQSEELKSYIDRKHREMEELLAESEGRLSEQLREKQR
jgi:hypothetical protein